MIAPLSTIVFIRDVASYILRPLDSLFARAGLIDGSINDSLPARPTLVEVICLLGLWSGATIVVMPKFELDTYLELVERQPLKDDDAGEIPRAFVVLRAPASAPELMEYVAQRVAPFKKIRRLEFIDAIPKSPSGKILRRLLRDVALT
jgi:acyl-CoA synthetase (AMP-forming)/AMP-acid ligase II